jgi:hydroxymethylbilane synthase/uroporphyrinogen III methyltransferase/synthase
MPHLECVSIRGNVPTRLKKLDDGEFDGIVLAAAGLKRLELFDYDRYDYRFFETDEILPAGGQGIIAIEGRRDDAISAMVEQISDKDTFAELACERTVLNVLQAGCHEAVGIYACVENSNDELIGIEKFDGKSVRRELPGDSYIRLKVMKEAGGELYFEKGEILLDGNEINDELRKGKMLAEEVAAKLLKKING